MQLSALGGGHSLQKLMWRLHIVWFLCTLPIAVYWDLNGRTATMLMACCLWFVLCAYNIHCSCQCNEVNVPAMVCQHYYWALPRWPPASGVCVHTLDLLLKMCEDLGVPLTWQTCKANRLMTKWFEMWILPLHTVYVNALYLQTTTHTFKYQAWTTTDTIRGQKWASFKGGWARLKVYYSKFRKIALCVSRWLLFTAKSLQVTS